MFIQQFPVWHKVRGFMLPMNILALALPTKMIDRIKKALCKNPLNLHIGNNGGLSPLSTTIVVFGKGSSYQNFASFLHPNSLGSLIAPLRIS